MLKQRRMTDQHPVLESVAPQAEHADELLPDVIDNGLGEGGLGERRALVDLRRVPGIGDRDQRQAARADGELRERGRPAAVRKDEPAPPPSAPARLNPGYLVPRFRSGTGVIVYPAGTSRPVR